MIARLFEQDMLLFSVPAVFGTALFLIRIGMMSLGGDGLDGDGDAGADFDPDLGDDVEQGDSNAAFKLLSLQAVAAMLMGFGWGGLGGRMGMDWPLATSLLVGVGFGLVLLWLLGMMLKGIHALQGSGNIDARRAIGGEGSVYARIPAKGDGRGQVRVVVDERARIYNAVSDGDAIERNARVRVASVGRDRTMTVRSL